MKAVVLNRGSLKPLGATESSKGATNISILKTFSGPKLINEGSHPYGLNYTSWNKK